MPGTPFTLQTEAVGGHLTVDGVPVPDDQVLAAEVIVANDRPTRLIVHVKAAGVIEGEGVVEVVRDGVSGDRVRALDANKIRAGFAARNQGLGQSAAATYRDVIAEMLDEAGP